MDTSDFDKQAKTHLAVYNGFMTASKIVIGLVIVVLVAMAATLLQIYFTVCTVPDTKGGLKPAFVFGILYI